MARAAMTGLELLRLAQNDLIGYAGGGADAGWSAVKECLDKGWLVYERDVDISRHGLEFGRGTYYRVTNAGRAALAAH